MASPQVTLRVRYWERLGHGGLSKEANYEIFLGDTRLRGFSTHGDMTEGYWGTSAKKNAEIYSSNVAKELGTQVVRVRYK